ncbi:MAG: HAD hydrolase-like protein [Candidatus Omnitrophota bacterium]
MTKWKKHVLFRIIAALIITLMLHHDIVWAVGDVSGATNGNCIDFHGAADETKKIIDIPKGLARVEEEFDLSSAAETIITIQDCHSSLSAQYSIVNILQELTANYDLGIVAVEGGSGFINTALLGSCPDQDAKEKTAEFLMKQSQISAGEFFSILNNDKAVLYGVEDNQLYRKNIKYFQKVYALNRERIKFAENLSDKLKEKENEIYSKEFSRFVFKSRLHRKGKISFEMYWQFLHKIAAQHNLNLQIYKNIKKFNRAIALEKNIDFQNAALQRTKVVGLILAKSTKKELESLARETILLKQQRITESSYYKNLSMIASKKDVDINEYTDLAGYIEYLSFYDNLNIFGVQMETKFLEEEIIKKISLTNKEKLLYDLVEFTEKLKLFLALKSNPDQTNSILRQIPEINLSDYFMFLEKDECITEKSVIAFLAGVKDNIEFYKTADARNKAMIANTVKAMKKEGKSAAALISGGYHTKGLTTLMKQNGLSYLILMPRFSKDEERPYVTILTKKKDPYIELAQEGAYSLALPLLSESKEITQFDEAIIYTAVHIVRSGGSLEAKKQKWIKDYKNACSRLPSNETHDILVKAFEKRLNTVKVDVQDEFFIGKIGNKTYRVDDEKIELLNSSKAHGKKVLAAKRIWLYLEKIAKLSCVLERQVLIETFYFFGRNKALLAGSYFAEQLLEEFTDAFVIAKPKTVKTGSDQKLKIAFFDWDGTVTNTHLVALEAFKKVYLEVGGREEDYFTFWKQIDGLSGIKQYEIYKEIAKKNRKEFNYKDGIHFVKRIVAIRNEIMKKEFGGKIPLVNNIEEVFKKLREQGAEIHIASGLSTKELKRQIKSIRFCRIFFRRVRKRFKFLGKNNPAKNEGGIYYKNA